MSSLRKIPFSLIPGGWVCWCLWTPGTAAQTPQRVPVEAQAPLEKQALRAAQGPLKLDVRPLAQGARLGGKVSVDIVLLDAANGRAVWNQTSEVRVEVTVTGPSRRPKVYQVSIGPGESAVQFAFEATEAGLLSLKVREVSNRLLSGGNSVLVRKPVAIRPVPPREPVNLLQVAVHVVEPRALLAAAEPAEQEPQTATLLLEDSTGREILADGKDFARIKVYFVDPQGESARSDIKVWLTWSNGELNPHPLVIKKGDFVAETRWVSRSPLKATLSFVTSAPNFAIEGASELKVSFAPPIHGILFLNPSPLSLSLIDYAHVQVAFFTVQDGAVKIIKTNQPRRVTFTPSNTVLRVNPLDSDVQSNESGVSVYVLPTWGGHSVLRVSTPDYASPALEVQVTMGLVLILCLSGGVLGGLAATKSLKRPLLWRVFIGILGAIALVWISVYAVLPQTFSIVAHNPVSVFVVGIVGGYGGTRVLDVLGKKLGYL